MVATSHLSLLPVSFAQMMHYVPPQIPEDGIPSDFTHAYLLKYWGERKENLWQDKRRIEEVVYQKKSWKFFFIAEKLACKVEFCQSTSVKEFFTPPCASSNPDFKYVTWYNTFHQFGSYFRWKNTSGSFCNQRYTIDSRDRPQSEWKLRKRIAFIILILILSESEIEGWFKSRNLELFYYLGHNFLPTFLYMVWYLKMKVYSLFFTHCNLQWFVIWLTNVK